MSTLETNQFVFEPDMDIIRQQCEQMVLRDPSLAQKVLLALKTFDEARGHVNRGDAAEAYEKLSSETITSIFDQGAHELEASWLFYCGFLAFAAGGTESGIDMLNGALRRTKNPTLALNVYNRLMIHYLSNDEYDHVERYANATKRVVDKLPKSKFVEYHAAAADYNMAESRFRQSKYADVTPFIQAAITGFSKLTMTAEVMKCKGLLGNTLINLGDVDRGLRETEESLSQFRNMGNEREVPFLLLGRASALEKKGEKKASVADLRAALKLFQKFKEIKAVNTTLALLAQIEIQ